MALPLLLGIAFNVINIGYFWYVALNLAAIPRQGVEYASQGGPAIAVASGPSTSLIQTLVTYNMSGALNVTNASIQVCATSVGAVDPSTNKTPCSTSGPSYTFPGPAADPESPVFVLNRVDVAYQVTPIIPGSVFYVLLPSNLTFHRQVSMRSLY